MTFGPWGEDSPCLAGEAMSAIGESAPDPTRPQSLSRADQRALQHTKKSRDREATHLASSKDKVRRLATADRFFDNQQFLQEQIAYQQESTARASLIAAHQAEINRLQCLYTVASPESKEGIKSSPGAESIAAPTTSKWHAELLSLNENAPQAALAKQALAQSPREDGWSRSRRSSVDAKRSSGSDFPKLPMPPGQSF